MVYEFAPDKLAIREFSVIHNHSFTLEFSPLEDVHVTPFLESKSSRFQSWSVWLAAIAAVIRRLWCIRTKL